MDDVGPRAFALHPSGLWRHLPRGRALPEDVWWQRHRGILGLLWAHVPVIFVIALLQSVGLVHAAFETGVIIALATLATASREHRRLSTVIVAVGLLTCSAELVHLSHGLIEMHFHFFVMVGIVTLYQDWQPFLIAIGYVVLQHGVAGAISPASVYNHPEAVSQPWKWAAIHGGFILAMSTAGIVTWRLNESLLAVATEREEELAEAHAAARLGSWVMRPALGAVSFSRPSFDLFGLAPDVEVTTELLRSLVHPQDRQAFDDALGELIRGRPQAVDFRVVLPNDEVRWLHGRGEVTAWDGTAPATLAGTLQDVTERRRAEEALRKSESDLRASNEQLARSDTLKGVFISTVSHELNTPLTAITGFTRMLTQSWGSLPDAERLEMLDRIERNSRLLGGLINEVLDFSRLERGQSRLRSDPLDVARLVTAVVDQLGVVLARHRVSVTVAEGAIVDGDPDALTRVVTNLLTNAAKFSPDGTTIHVTVDADDGVATVTVADEGPGIRLDESDLIFEPFYRSSDDAVLGHPGTGIGLAVVKDLTERMGGSVTVDLRRSDGAQFEVRLPLADRQRATPVA